MTVFAAYSGVQPHLLHEPKYLLMVDPNPMILEQKQLNLTIAINAVIAVERDADQLFERFILIGVYTFNIGVKSASGNAYFFTKLCNAEMFSELFDEPIFL